MAKDRGGASDTNGTPQATGKAKGRARDAESDPAPVVTRSGPIAAAGVRTGEDFANLMSALMSDLVEGNISPNTANATVNAGGKLLKVVEMQYRYGSEKSTGTRNLTLASG